MKQKFTEKDLVSINTMLYELTCLRRWSEVTVEAGKYTELAKQGFNCMVAYFWANEAIHQGVNIDLKLFPKIAIMRAFTKTFQCDVPEANLEKIFATGKVSKQSFQQMIAQQISKITSETFQRHLLFEDSIESRIFKASSKLCTLLELEEIQNGISAKSFKEKHEELQKDVDSFSDVPGFFQMTSDNYLEIFRDFSQLRNRIRWAKHPNIIKCSVLGHHFDVAVFAYLMSLEAKPLEEDLATRLFFMGIFHDFPEKWTGDMPSPIKDAIPGLREATEDFENQVMEANVYCNLPHYQVQVLREVMLEDAINIALKKPLKKSDNYSAFVECWRELDAGSNHTYYVEVLRKDFAKKENLPEIFRLLAEKLYGSVNFR